VFFVPLIRWLANHDNPRVVLGVGVVLVCVGIGVGAVGLDMHEPALTRIGVLLLIVSIAVFVIRGRRGRSDPRNRTDQ